MTLLREQHTEREVPGAGRRGGYDGVVQRGDTGHGADHCGAGWAGHSPPLQLELNSMPSLVSNRSFSTNQTVSIQTKTQDVPGTLRGRSSSRSITARQLTGTCPSDTDFKPFCQRYNWQSSLEGA